jgi:hypothetical protein
VSISGVSRTQEVLFASDPWATITTGVRRRCPQNAQLAALAFVRQAEHNYRTAIAASLIESKPVLLYYSFLNLVKAYLLTVQQQPSVDRAKHGMSEKLKVGGQEFVDAFISLIPTIQASEVSIFDEFHTALTGAHMQARIDWDLPAMAPQILPGHRMWAATTLTDPERFVRLDNLVAHAEPGPNPGAWLSFDVHDQDVARAGLTAVDFATAAGLPGNWTQVHATPGDGRLTFESDLVQPVGTETASDCAARLSGTLVRALWSTVVAAPPYRRYYAFRRAASETVLPQLLSTYAFVFYLGSVTRYRPHHFERVVVGDYGPFVQEFIAAAPSQFIFMMASFFANQDVVRPALA